MQWGAGLVDPNLKKIDLEAELRILSTSDMHKIEILPTEKDVSGDDTTARKFVEKSSKLKI